MSVTPADLASGTTTWDTVKQNSHLAATRTGVFFEHCLGGDSVVGHPNAAWERVVGSKPLYIPSSVELSGTWKFISFLVCEDASVGITTKLYDLTAAADVALSTGVAASGTSLSYSGADQIQISPALTLVAGHYYAAYAMKSDTIKACWVDAVYLQRTN